MEKEIVLGGRRLMVRPGVHGYLAQKLELPSYYGRNLDALWDCLCEMPRGTVVRIRFARELDEGGGYGRRILETFRDAAEEGWILLREE